MFAELNNILDIKSDHPPLGQNWLAISRGADCSFILHHMVSLYLKSNYKVCLVGFAQSFSHYNNVGNKLGVSLKAAKESDNFQFVDGLKGLGDSILENVEASCNSNTKDLKLDKDLFNIFNEDGCNLKNLYTLIKMSFEKLHNESGVPVLMIIDDISVLLSMGVPSKNIMMFNHYLCQLVCQSKHSTGCFVVIYPQPQKVEDDETSSLQTYLHHQCTRFLRVEGLLSGYSKDVHGSLFVEWRDPANNQTTLSQKSKCMQFKLTDKNLTLFALGMSSAVL